MKEQLINFKTAKLAKEKGFDNTQYGDWLGQFFWYSKDEVSFYYSSLEENEDVEWMDKSKDFIPRPSQSLLQKWLREKYNIHIQITKHFTCYAFQILRYNKFEDNNEIIVDELLADYETYEETLEIGLYEALKLI